MQQEQKEQLLSVGIDIGTSTTQLVFSQLTVENLASAFAVPRIQITEKKILYTSPIYLTPLSDDITIDGEEIKKIISQEYQAAEAAEINTKRIQTGAVIITGETARKSNAKEVLQVLSEFAGDFVVATAGPDLESMIAGKGAGTDELSKIHGVGIVNFDIGGGTSNLAFFQNGDLKDTACLDVGGRLIKMEPTTQKITYLSPKIQQYFNAQQNLKVGSIITKEQLQPVVQGLVHCLEQSIGLLEQDALYQGMLTNRGLHLPNLQIQGITFSGGVADIIYHPEAYPEEDWCRYGDIGILLGKAIRTSKLFQEKTIYQGKETIRATVIGAGSHTMDVSGSTIAYEHLTFPIKNLPVLKISAEAEKTLLFAPELQRKLQWFQNQYEQNWQQEQLVLAFQGKKNPSFTEVQQYAEQILAGMKEYLNQQQGLLLVLQEDMGKVLGNALLSLDPSLKQNGLLSLDGIAANEGDYLDVGAPIADGKVLPVVIKTLAFSK